MIATIIFIIIAAITAYFACRYFNAATEAADAQREKTELENFEARQRILRQMAYDGCAFAENEAAKKKKKSGESLSSEGKKCEAVDYVLRWVDWAEEPQTADVVESCLAKVSGAGASGAAKI